MNEECSVDVIKLELDPPEKLGQCVCQTYSEGSLFYLFLRDLFCAYNFGMLLAGIILTMLDKKLKLYIFFDFWTQALLFISSEFGVYGVVRLYSESMDDYNDFYWESVPWYCKIYWALFSAALPSTILSCCLFWSQIFYKNIHIVHIIMNTVTPFVAILEFIFIAFPLRLLHFFFFLFFFLIYVLFTLTYQKCGGTGVNGSDTIYKLVDWKRPEKAVLYCCVGLAIGLGSYFLFCFISIAKMACKNRSEYY